MVTAYFLPSRTPRIIVRVYSLLAKIIVTVLAQVPVRLRAESQGLKLVLLLR